MASSREDRDGETLSKELEEEEEVEKLEMEVKRMAEEIMEARATLPGLLSSTLSSLLAAGRPKGTVSDPGPSPSSDPAAQGGVEWEREMEEKARLVKERMGRNASEMRVVLKRLRESVSRTEKLRATTCNGTSDVHLAFRKRKIVFP